LAFGLPFKFLDATLGGVIMLVVSISKENMGAGLDSCKAASVSRAPYCPVFFAFGSSHSPPEKILSPARHRKNGTHTSILSARRTLHLALDHNTVSQ